MRSLLKKICAIVAGVAILTLAACNLPTAQTMPTADPKAYVKTSAAETVTALKTAGAFNTLPTNTPVPTQTQATTTLQVTKTISAVTPCDRAGFSEDVTVPDGTKISMGEPFTKTWRLKNTGSCNWNNNYAIVFVDGNALGAAPAVNLPGSVAPNQEINVSVEMKAPDKSGSYKGNWKLRNSDGVIFGLADNSAFFVAIDVIGEEYAFASNYCDADWSNASAVLSCPGAKNDHQGFVMKLDKPKVETGDPASDATIETHPQWVNDGMIVGKFPEITVQSGQRFKSQIGCVYQATSCNVKFKVSYQVEGGSTQILKEWAKTYNGKMVSVDEDLSALVGKKVAFILTVTTNGVPTQDWAIWVNPRLSH
jgi:hypothetical protein